MSQISEQPTPLRVVAGGGRFGRPAVQMMLSAAAIVAVLCAPLIYSSIRHATSPGPQIALRPLTSEEKMMVEVSRKDLQVFSDIINSHENIDESLSDSAAVAMAGLSDKEMRERLGF
jgi:hypothetical protein